MLRDTSIAMVLAMVLSAPGWAQGPSMMPSISDMSQTRVRESLQPLSSPSAAARLRDVAYDVAYSKTFTGPQADQAIVLLSAARNLSSSVAPVEPLLLRLACGQTERDYSDHIIAWLQSYVGPSCDRVVVKDSVQWLLNRAGSWEDRKRILEDLVRRIGNRNAAVDSDLAMLLGFLMGQKGDLATAKFYLMQAYKSNKHNKIAFAKLAEIAPDEIGPGIFLQHLRLILRENPLDLNAALNFAQYAERLQLYDTASAAYQYSAEVFRYLYPTEPLSPNIYLPWAVCGYNTTRGQAVSMQIAESVRNSGQFDILLEAVAGRAAAKMGNAQESRRILQQAQDKAQQLFQTGAQQGGAAQTVTPRQFAWFYCFGDPDARKALDWANKAYAAEPNSPAVGALLAYAMSMNKQMEWARPLVKACPDNQITDIVQANFYVAEGRKDEAVKTLKMAINKDAGSLAAEQAREMLKGLQGQYTPPIDTGMLMSFLTESFGQNAIPQFLTPDKMIQVQFSIRGNEFPYGSDIEGMVAVVNQGPEPMVVSDDGLFKGGVRIDVRVSGDLQKEIAPLVLQTVRTELLVQPGRSLVIPVRLSAGELGELLRSHPQATLDIQFTLYIDPVVSDGGAVSNRLVDLRPVTAAVKRPGVRIDAKYVRTRFGAIPSAQPNQRIATAQLFAGLIKEQYAMAERTLYPFRYADWMPGMLRSAFTSDSGLLLGSGEDNWAVAVHALAETLAMPLDTDMTAALAKDLNHPNWPVRMMALYVLGNSSGSDFTRVSDWYMQNDSSEYVRSMAAALRPRPPQMTSDGPLQ